MIASEAFRADLANARLGHERAAKALKAVEQVVADLATDDTIFFLCPRADCRESFQFGQLQGRMLCPPHDNVETGRLCTGTRGPVRILYIAAADFANADALGVTEEEAAKQHAELAAEVAELERL